VSPPQLGIRKAAVGKKLAFEGPDVLSHQFTITTLSFVKTEMLKAFSGCTYCGKSIRNWWDLLN
jgi:hypothetical protein